MVGWDIFIIKNFNINTGTVSLSGNLTFKSLKSVSEAKKSTYSKWNQTLFLVFDMVYYFCEAWMIWNIITEKTSPTENIILLYR